MMETKQMDNRTPAQSQGLLGQVKTEKKPLPKGFFALLGTEIASVLLAGILGYLARLFFESRLNFWIFFMAAAIFLTVSSFGALFGTNRYRRLGVIIAETLLFFIAFREFPEGIWLFAFVAAAICSWWGDYSAHAELHDRVHIRLFPVLRLKIGRTVTGLLVAGIILLSPAWSSTAPVSEKQFETVYRSAAGIFAVIYPQLKFDASVNELAMSIVRNELTGARQFEDLPPDMQDQQLRQAANEVIQQTGNNLEFELRPDMKVSEAFYLYLTGIFAGWQKSFGQTFILLWGIGLFIVLRGLGAILVWIAMLLTMFVYQMLAASGIVGIIGEPAMRERLVIYKG